MAQAITPFKLLQQLYSSANHSRALQLIGEQQQLQQQQLRPEHIDELVGMELTRLRVQFHHEEMDHAEEMVQQFCLELDGRKSQNGNGSSNSCAGSNDERSDLTDSDTLLRRQRAESCRKSRRNNKIKKAKMQYRHQFISKRLQQSRQTLDCLQMVLAQAERQLLCKGYSPAALEQLRRTFRVDRIPPTPMQNDI